MTSRQKRKIKRKIKRGCGDLIPYSQGQLGEVKEKENKRNAAMRGDPTTPHTQDKRIRNR